MRDGENGYFVENSSDDMAAHVIKLLRSKKLRSEMGERSKQIARNLTEKRQVKKLETLYRKVVRAAEKKRAEHLVLEDS